MAFALTEPPPLENLNSSQPVVVAPLISISKGKDQRNVVVPQINNTLKNSLTNRNKFSSTLNTYKQFDSDIQTLEQTETKIQANLKDLKKAINRISNDLSDTRNKSDLCQIRINPAIPMKAEAKFQDIRTEIDTLTKRIESKENKFSQNEQKIYAKIHELQSTVNQFEPNTDFTSPDYSNILLRIDQINSFVQQHQYIFLDKFLKTKNQNANIQIPDSLINFETNVSKPLNDHIKSCNSKIDQESLRINNRIQKLSDSLTNKNFTSSNSSEFIASIQNKNQQLNSQFNQLQNYNETIQNQLNDRLANIENTMNSFLESIGDEVPEMSTLEYNSDLFKPIFDDGLNQVKQLSKDWELFHRNNVTVQRQVFQHIGDFDQDVSLNIPLLGRIEAAEKMANYCVERVKQWKLEEEQKMAMGVDEPTLLAKVKEMEEKVALAEDRLEEYDQKSPKTPPFSLKSPIEMSVPLKPKLIDNENDDKIEPIVLDSNLILTYNQEQMNQEISLPDAPRIQCITATEEKSSTFATLKLPERIVTEKPEPKIELKSPAILPLTPINNVSVTPTSDQPLNNMQPPTTPVMHETIDRIITAKIADSPPKEKQPKIKEKEKSIKPILVPVVAKIPTVPNQTAPLVTQEMPLEVKEQESINPKNDQIQEIKEKNVPLAPPIANPISIPAEVAPQTASIQPQVLAQSTPNEQLELPQPASQPNNEIVPQSIQEPNTNEIIEKQAEVKATENEPHIDDANPTEEDKPAEQEKATEEDKPAEQENPTEEDKPAEEDKPIEEENPTEEDKPAEEENPTEEDKPAEEENPTEEDKPIEEEKTAEEDNPADEEKPIEELKSVENVNPADDDNPTEKPRPDEDNVNLNELRQDSMNDSTLDDAPSYYVPSSSLERIKLFHKKRRSTNRCYDPFTPAKKGEPLNFV